MNRNDSYRRGGLMYAVVLGAAMVVTVIGVGALMSVRVVRRAADDARNLAQARYHAQSAIELGMFQLDSDTNWRTSRTSGAWAVDQPIGLGTYSLDVIDPVDGDFANNTDDHVIVTGTGKAGNALYKLSVELEPDGPPGVDALASAIHVSSLFRTFATVNVDAPISSNQSIEIEQGGGVVNGNVEAVGTVFVGGTLNGTLALGITPKEEPAATVFDYYLANATPIDIYSMSSNNTYYEMIQQLVAPNCVPYGGATNADGLYVIDCKNEQLRIRDGRIHGTLVILDPGPNSIIEGAINWEPVRPDLPALLVRGSIEFAWSGPLVEGSTDNFNPPGCPYQGVSDSDNVDVYPGVIKGLIMVSQNLTVSASESIEGVVLTLNNMDVTAALNVTHDPAIINNPPPGFERSFRPMVPVGGSWARLAN